MRGRRICVRCPPRGRQRGSGLPPLSELLLLRALCCACRSPSACALACHVTTLITLAAAACSKGNVLTSPLPICSSHTLQAKPIVADYPFTTLHPTIGVVSGRDGFTLTVADIPGLIEGAHADRGLGHEFLRHVERTKVLVYVVDVSKYRGSAAAAAAAGAGGGSATSAEAAAGSSGGSEAGSAAAPKRRGRPPTRSASASSAAPPDSDSVSNSGSSSSGAAAYVDPFLHKTGGDEAAASGTALPASDSDIADRAGSGLSNSDPAEDLRILQRELQLYNPALAAKPSLVIANKIDLPGAKAGVARLRAATALPVMEVSAKQGRNVGLVVDSLRWLLETQAKMAARAAAEAQAAADAEAAAAAAAPRADEAAGPFDARKRRRRPARDAAAADDDTADAATAGAAGKGVRLAAEDEAEEGHESGSDAAVRDDSDHRGSPADAGRTRRERAPAGEDEEVAGSDDSVALSSRGRSRGRGRQRGGRSSLQSSGSHTIAAADE